MGYSIKLTGSKRKKAESLLIEIVDLINQNNIHYALEGGTLLGIYRENRLLPWDSDVDLSILCCQLGKVDTLINDLNKHGYRVRTRYFESNNTPFEKGNPRIIKIRNKSFFGLLKASVCLEIFIKYKHNNHVYWQVAGNTMAAPLRFYENHNKIEFLDRTFIIPNETENYLTHKYGNWKVPVKQWDASTDERSLVA